MLTLLISEAVKLMEYDIDYDETLIDVHEHELKYAVLVPVWLCASSAPWAGKLKTWPTTGMLSTFHPHSIPAKKGLLQGY